MHLVQIYRIFTLNYLLLSHYCYFCALNFVLVNTVNVTFLSVGSFSPFESLCKFLSYLFSLQVCRVSLGQNGFLRMKIPDWILHQCEVFSDGCLKRNYTGCDILGYFGTCKHNTSKSPSFQMLSNLLTGNNTQ